MITFTRDTLVPPELCRLLYQTVPTEYHVPVIFNNHSAQIGYRSELGGSYFPIQEVISINLHMIYSHAVRSWANDSLASILWRELVRICYHEFGHAASREQALQVAFAEYRAKGRGYKWVEKLADDWMNERLQVLLHHDTRLTQPAKIGGYFGARLSRRYRALKHASNKSDGSAKAQLVAECRYMKTGGQYTSGGMVRELRWDGELPYRKRYAVLRQISAGMGIDYVDGAGRKHKLYTHGDALVLQRRLSIYAASGYNTGTTKQAAPMREH